MPFLPAATFVQAARLRPGSKECEVSKFSAAVSCNLCSYAFLHDFEQNRSIHFRCTIKPS